MTAATKTEITPVQSDYDTLIAIIEGEYIEAVFQPIVSLTNGQTYGYEALSRISNGDLKMDIERGFRLSDRFNKSWELETLSRRKALDSAVKIGADKKLFLNVNPNIIYDNKFREGLTKNRLNEYGLNINNIVFEITERVAILDANAFAGSIDHYKAQDYGIAIDDFGPGYSGLNIVASVRPKFLKLDMNLVRNIDKDEIKQLLCRAMVDFGKSAGILLIAEGIETEEELIELMMLKVNFGQGYFLGVPQEDFLDISAEKVKIIKKHHENQYIK